MNSVLEMRRTRAEESGAALTKQIGVTQLVDRVFQVQPAQERIRRDLRGAQDVASAVGLDFGEREQLAHAPVEVAPHPPVNRPQHPVERCDSREWRHIDFPEEADEEQTSISL